MTAQAAPARTAQTSPLDRLLAARIAINWEIAVYAALFAVAFGLRFWDLGSDALHHDESIHAQWSWRLAQGDYKHDPIFHGPFYYHLQGLVFILFGASDYTARVSAAVFGCILTALPLLLRKRLGGVGTFAAVALIAFSPTIVYYSRFFREDIYMAGFTLAIVVAMWRYLDGGRDRWLIVFALAFTGSVATKEATYLTAAVFLIFLDVFLSAQLARACLEARESHSSVRRIMLTLALSPFAWVLASLWPFLPGVRRRFDWSNLPRSGDVLIVLGTLTLPLLTAFLKAPLERFDIVDKGQLVCGQALTRQHAVAIGGLFLMTCAGAAFVGLQWRPKTWAIAAGLSALVYLTLYTSLWKNPDGLCTGPWGSLDYWRSQQDVYRGDQPWYYYNLILPAYEYLPLAIAIGGAWWSLVKGDAFSRFLWVWLIGFYLGLSWGSEKMPWLNTHLALPTCLLAAWTIMRAWRAWSPSAPDIRSAIVPLASVAVVAAGALLLIAYPIAASSVPWTGFLLALLVVGVVAFGAKPYGRRAAGTFAIAAAIGALSFFSLRTMVEASFVRGDVPKDMLIYTQSSPEIPKLMADISALAESSGLGYQLPIAVDSTDSFAWPWAWYLRDYKAVSYVDFTNGPPSGDFSVLLVNSSNFSKTNDQLASGSGTLYGKPIKYPHRWWFNEGYKDGLNLGHGACTAQYGDCGPWTAVKAGPVHVPWVNTDVWGEIGHNLFRSTSWWTSWGSFWRDHDPDKILPASADKWAECMSCGSVDAYAYFPANFDLATKIVKPVTVEAVKPSVDASGLRSFGGFGRQPGQFFAPTDIEQDADGNLYVIDSKTKRLQKFDKDGNYLAGVDVRTKAGDTTEQSEPWGLGIAPDGRVVVADTFGWQVRVFDKDLKPLVHFGQPPGPPADPVTPQQLYGPRDIAFDRSGNMWITDTGHARILVYTMDGQFVRQIGDGTKGKGPNQFNEPVGISQAPDGTYAVADMFNARVVLLDQQGNQTGQFPVEGWGGQDVTDKPYLRFLRDGRLALSLPGLNQVRIYDRSGNIQGSVTPAGEALSKPYGMLETADGKLWIVDGGASRVRQVLIP